LAPGFRGPGNRERTWYSANSSHGASPLSNLKIHIERALVQISSSNLKTLIRRSVLSVLKGAGGFHLVANSRWRTQRLLILCYHGVSIDDEHQWRPALYMAPGLLERRLQILKQGGYSVLPLGEGLDRLYRGDLPSRSVALTFDDGGYDFYKQGYPLLKKYGLPATVYQTTYYSDHQMPIFNLACSYMLWKRRERKVLDGQSVSLPGQWDITSEAGRRSVVDKLLALVEERHLTGAQKNEVARELARSLEFDYEEFCRRRILQVMAPQEFAELSAAGVDIQLHTHRHRTPLNEDLFRREIRENRERIEAAIKVRPVHFCYPSGAWTREFQPWLEAEGVVSATTCDTGLADSESNALFLPRFVDTTARSEAEFESWVSGVGHFLSRRKRARLADFARHEA
jgi:peptidoglycan/xylan/chitin deacetylase (PgdA/CDA1 family)